ncbi:MAG: T9SS type A sorting domain-containing protein [Bacteroidota bacterium]
MRGLPILLCVCLSSGWGWCMAQDWSTSQILGTQGVTQCQGLSFCSDAGYVLAGAFSSSLTLNDNTFTTNGEDDLVLARFDEAGELLWAKHYGSVLDDRFAKIIVLENDHTLGVGIFWVTIELGPFELNTTQSPKAIFIAEWDEMGTVLWAKAITGTGLLDINDLGVDAEENLHLAGYFGESLQYDGLGLTANGQTDLFVLKLTATGAPIWASHAGQSRDARAVGLSVLDDQRVFVSGFYNDTLVVANDTLTAFSFDDDTFLAEFSPTGVPLGAKKLGGVFDDQVVALVRDAEGAVYQVGYLTGVIGITEDWSIESTSIRPNTYVIKFSSDGVPLWAKTFGDAALFQATAAELTGDQLLITGVYEQTHTIGNTTISATNGTTDGFFMSLQLNGELELVHSIPGTGQTRPSQVTLGTAGNLLVGGGFEQSLLVPFERTAAGDFDIFILGKQDAILPTEEPATLPNEVVFPNPNDGLLHLPKSCISWYVKVFNDLGQLLLEASASEQLDLQGLSAGRYHVQLQGCNQSISQTLIVVN